MPLSKKRNSARMRQARLHGKENTGIRKTVQPKYVVRPAMIMLKADDVASTTTTNASSQVWVDADGNPIYED